MELSTVVQQYDLPLTQSERTLVISASTGGTASVSGDRTEQQMKALADARAVLARLPSRKAAERQNAGEKIRMLKERLRMLKQMIPFMSPSAAKSLKAELKQIAAQLASLGAGSGGGGDDVSTTAGSTDGPAQAQTSESKAAESTDTAATKRSADPAVDPNQNSAALADLTADRNLRGEIEELKRLYGSVRAMVQRKLQQARDRGEPLPQLSPAAQAYITLPAPGGRVTVQA